MLDDLSYIKEFGKNLMKNIDYSSLDLFSSRDRGMLDALSNIKDSRNNLRKTPCLHCYIYF